MERKIVAYTLETGTNSFELYKAVRKKLEEGYQPYGSPAVSTSIALGNYGRSTHDVYIQAMVKYE